MFVSPPWQRLQQRAPACALVTRQGWLEILCARADLSFSARPGLRNFLAGADSGGQDTIISWEPVTAGTVIGLDASQRREVVPDAVRPLAGEHALRAKVDCANQRLAAGDAVLAVR